MTVTERVSITERATVTETSAVSSAASLDGWPEPYAIGLAPSPAFVDHIDGWRLEQQWETTVRVFEDQWSAAPGSETDEYRFPATQNGCDNQMFLVRWRGVGSREGQPITASWTYSSDVGSTPDQVGRVEGGKKVTGDAGWIALYGCEVPVFNFQPTNADSGSLRDVAIAVQQWYPSAAG